MEKTTNTGLALRPSGSIWPRKVFQFHGIDSSSKVVIRRAVKRQELLALQRSFRFA